MTLLDWALVVVWLVQQLLVAPVLLLVDNALAPVLSELIVTTLHHIRLAVPQLALEG